MGDGGNAAVQGLSGALAACAAGIGMQPPAALLVATLT